MTISAGELLSLTMLATLALALFSGLPVAVVLIGVSLGFGGLGILTGDVRPEEFGAIFFRVNGTLTESEDLAYASVPLLVFMGVMFQAAGLAEDLLAGLQRFAGNAGAALPVAVLALGVVLAPAAGVIGASVAALAAIALPALLGRGYAAPAAAGIVAAAGTLGVVVPPSIMLFFIADALGVQVPAMFLAMIFPVLILIGSYALFVLRGGVPGVALTGVAGGRVVPLALAARRMLAPVALLVAMVVAVVLGWSTLSEAAALGAAGATLIALATRRIDRQKWHEVIRRTALMTSVIFFIFVGATLFSLMFQFLGGARLLAAGLRSLQLGDAWTLGAVLFAVFVLGFFFDWLELVVIAFPILKPVLLELSFAGHAGPGPFAACWVAVLMTMALQTSFLTPPFGYALFLTRAAAPAIRMLELYRGVMPYVAIQLLVAALVAAVPSLATWLPERLLDQQVERPERFHD